MPLVRLGRNAIPYEIRRTARSKRIRVTVRPRRLLVTAPRRTPLRAIVAFVESKREWIFEARSRLAAHTEFALPEHFVSGARLLFRGRRLQLWIKDGARRSLRYASAFHVTLEAGLDAQERERAARGLVLAWLGERVLEDAHGWSRKYGPVLGVKPTRIRLGNQKTLWGSCSARGVIALNWRLITTPKPVFEYVVVHELCHLVEHNHGRRFWSLVESLLPDYRERRAWLKRRGVALG